MIPTEPQITDLAHELAYERVKRSILFDKLDNAAVDAKADELAGRLVATMEAWLSDETSHTGAAR